MSTGEGDNRKDFYAARHFRGTWQDGREICHNYGLEFVSLDTESEYYNFERLVTNYPVNTYIYIGAMTTSPRNNIWFWMNSGNQMTYPIKWWPGEPTNTGEFCLMFERAGGNQLQAHDIDCSHRFEKAKIICQERQHSGVFTK